MSHTDAALKNIPYLRIMFRINQNICKQACVHVDRAGQHGP